MKIETVKVYKGKEVVVCNKTDVAVWNENGYFTSSQQKKAAEDAKALKEAEKKAAEDALNNGGGTPNTEQDQG